MAKSNMQSTDVVMSNGRSISEFYQMRLLEPEQLLARHEQAIAQTFFPILREIRKDGNPEQIIIQKAQHQAAISAMLERSLSVEELGLVDGVLNHALRSEPNEDANEMSITVLMDSRVSLPANISTYIEALLFDLQESKFSPHIVAAACQRIRRECKFIPAISEVLDMCKEIQATYYEQHKRVRAAIFDVKSAQRYLAELND